MAVIAQASTHAKHMFASKQIDLPNDDLYIVLMKPTLVFDKNIHGTFADVSTHELDDGFGYTQGGELLTNSGLVEDLVSSKSYIVARQNLWTANGGVLGVIGSYLIYNNTLPDKTVMGHVGFDGYTYSIPDGMSFLVRETIISLV